MPMLFKQPVPLRIGTLHVYLIKVRQTVLSCDSRILPWKCSTLSSVSVAVTRGITNQLVKAADKANF